MVQITEESPLAEELTGEEDSPEISDQEPSPDDQNEETQTEEEIEGISIQFGDEKPDPSDEELEPSEEQLRTADPWVRHVRNLNKDLSRQINQLKRKLSEQQQQSPSQVVAMDPGPKPTLEGCDYDSEVFEKKLSDWHESKLQHDRQAEEQRAKQQKANDAWNQRLAFYTERKDALPVADFEDSEVIIQNTLSTNQQGIIVHGCDDPALVVYALGKNPTKIAELAKETDNIKFAMQVGKLEGQMKVNKKKKPKSAPEKTIKSTGPPSGINDSKLRRARAEAERTGDYTEVHRLNSQLRKALRNKR